MKNNPLVPALHQEGENSRPFLSRKVEYAMIFNAAPGSPENHSSSAGWMGEGFYFTGCK
jgi:hypothetical protein